MTKEDCISRQSAIDAVSEACFELRGVFGRCEDALKALPSVQSEPHYCKECKWSRCHINVNKHDKSETYWWCLNWDGGTDEEGYCYEWEKRLDE